MLNTFALRIISSNILLLLVTVNSSDFPSSVIYTRMPSNFSNANKHAFKLNVLIYSVGVLSLVSEAGAVVLHFLFLSALFVTAVFILLHFL